MIFRWDDIKEPLELGKGFTLPEYEITGTSYGSCTSEYNTGEWGT